MRKTSVFWGIVSLVFLFSACLHGRHTVSVMGYRNQMVFLKKNLYYHVGKLPADWHDFYSKAKVVSFHNDKLGATISTDAFCGSGFEDLPLRTLTGQYFAGIAKRKVVKETEFKLADRGALRTISTGETDGVALKFDSVVVKKNDCTIDFVYIAPPANYDAGASDFETFYNGFKF